MTFPMVNKYSENFKVAQSYEQISGFSIRAILYKQNSIYIYIYITNKHMGKLYVEGATKLYIHYDMVHALYLSPC